LTEILTEILLSFDSSGRQSTFLERVGDQRKRKKGVVLEKKRAEKKKKKKSPFLVKYVVVAP
jgi:hypothetical protein